MNILHIRDHHLSGGAYEASQSVIDLVGGSVFTNRGHSTWKQACATIGGYSLPSLRSEVRRQIQFCRPDIVHLHNFKEFGTAAIRACVQEDVPAVWSCYDYWPLCPRDNFHGPWCRPFRCSPMGCYKYPKVAKVPMLGRNRRTRRALGLLNGIIALSCHSRVALEQVYGGRIDEIPLPITLPEDMPEIEKDRKLVAFVGGSAPNKGASVFVEMKRIVEARRPDVRCQQVWAGDRLGALCAIAKAHVLVVPEQWPNPGPVVVAEAGLVGTHVVASYTGGIREVPTASMWMADERSPAQFASGVFKALDSPPPDPAVPDYQKIETLLFRAYRCAAKG